MNVKYGSPRKDVFFFMHHNNNDYYFFNLSNE